MIRVPCCGRYSRSRTPRSALPAAYDNAAGKGRHPSHAPSVDAGLRREILRRIAKTIAADQARLTVLAEDLSAYAVREATDILAMQTVVGDHLDELRALGLVAQSEMIAVVRGWLPTEGATA